MNIGFFCTFFPDKKPFSKIPGYGYGGADESLLDLVMELHRLGHDIKIFSVGRQKRIAMESPAPGLELYRFPIMKLPFPQRTSPSLRAFFSHEFMRIALPFDFDILHLKLGNSPAEFAAMHYKKRYKVPVVLDIGGKQNSSWGGFSRRGLMRLYLATAYPRVLRTADIILLRSEAYLDDDTMLLPYRDKIRIVPQGVDYAFYSRDVRVPLDDFPFREKVGTHGILFYAGNLVEGKGVHILLDAFALAKKTQPHLLLCIAGSGPMLGFLRKKARDLGVADSVVFLGYVDKGTLRRLYRIADLFVLPSMSEGFPRVLLEAMATGTPVLASDIGANIGALGNGKVGFTARCFDSGDFAEKILSFFDHDDAWFGDEARKARQYAQQFTWRRTAKAIIDIYQELQ